MLGPMHSLADAVSRLWRRIAHAARPAPSRPRRLVPVLVSALVVGGTVTGAVLATAGGKPAAAGGDAPLALRTSPAPSAVTGAVVPMLGGSADGSSTPIPVPVVHASAAASTTSRSARSVPVAPLRGLKQADLMIVAPFSLSPRVRS